LKFLDSVIIITLPNLRYIMIAVLPYLTLTQM